MQDQCLTRSVYRLLSATALLSLAQDDLASLQKENERFSRGLPRELTMFHNSTSEAYQLRYGHSWNHIPYDRTGAGTMTRGARNPRRVHV